MALKSEKLFTMAVHLEFVQDFRREAFKEEEKHFLSEEVAQEKEYSYG